MKSASQSAHFSHKACAGLLAVGLLCAGGCSTVVEKTTGWLSSSADVIAVSSGRVMWGKANFARDRRGTLEMQGRGAAPMRCFGALRYTATSSGAIDMSCSDGGQFVLPFQELSPLSGLARGRAGPAAWGLTYGLSADKAAGYLGVPADQLEEPKSSPAGGSGAVSGGG